MTYAILIAIGTVMMKPNRLRNYNAADFASVSDLLDKTFPVPKDD